MENTLKQLWLTYKLYFEHSKTKYATMTSAEYATQSVKTFLEYLETGCEAYPEWKNDIESIILNEIRITNGLIECYDKPVVRQKSNKTRWSL